MKKRAVRALSVPLAADADRGRGAYDGLCRVVFKTEAGGWHYRYYYSGHIELRCHLYVSAENVVVPAKIGAVPVMGFCEGNEYFYTVLPADL